MAGRGQAVYVAAVHDAWKQYTTMITRFFIPISLFQVSFAHGISCRLCRAGAMRLCELNII